MVHLACEAGPVGTLGHRLLIVIPFSSLLQSDFLLLLKGNLSNMYFSRYVSNSSKLVLKCITLFLFFLETSNSNSVCSLESLTNMYHTWLTSSSSHSHQLFFSFVFIKKKKKEHFKPISAFSNTFHQFLCSSLFLVIKTCILVSLFFLLNYNI